MKRQSRNAIEQVAGSLRSGETSPAELKIAADLIRDGAGAELFGALVDQERNAGVEDSEGTFIARLMHRFEQIMPENAAVGTYLMGRLYGFAWKTVDHHVYNGIELWMHNTDSLDAANALLQLSTEPVRPALKKACSAWAKMIREKA